nr:wiskott-Aldrich syndrome protein homolog 1-like [Procambarus clarkii]
MGGSPPPVVPAQSVGLEFSDRADYPEVGLVLCDMLRGPVGDIYGVELETARRAAGCSAPVVAPVNLFREHDFPLLPVEEASVDVDVDDSLAAAMPRVLPYAPPVALAPPPEAVSPVAPPVAVAPPQEAVSPVAPPVALAPPPEAVSPVAPPVAVASPQEAVSEETFLIESCKIEFTVIQILGILGLSLWGFRRSTPNPVRASGAEPPPPKGERKLAAISRNMTSRYRGRKRARMPGEAIKKQSGFPD